MTQRVSAERLVEIKAAVEFKRKINAERFVLDGVVALQTKDVGDLLADLEEARAALRAAEWAVADDFHAKIDWLCPVCGGAKQYGHAPDCLIGNALAATEATNG